MNKVDLVYLFANGHSHWHNQELKYSLRSVEKNALNYRSVILVGDKPSYLNDKIIHVPHKDEQYYCKERRIMEKLLKACNSEEVSNPFCFFNDDYFLLKPIDFSNIPYYHKGYLKVAAEKLRGGAYKQSLTNTYNVLSEKGLNTKHFDLHYPMYYDKVKFPAIMAAYNWEIIAGYVIKSLYANSLKINGTRRSDNKIQRSHDKNEVLEAIGDTDLFSTAEISRTIMNILYNIYPEKSSYEI